MAVAVVDRIRDARYSYRIKDTIRGFSESNQLSVSCILMRF